MIKDKALRKAVTAVKAEGGKNARLAKAALDDIAPANWFIGEAVKFEYADKLITQRAANSDKNSSQFDAVWFDEATEGVSEAFSSGVNKALEREVEAGRMRLEETIPEKRPLLLVNKLAEQPSVDVPNPDMDYQFMLAQVMAAGRRMFEQVARISNVGGDLAAKLNGGWRSLEIFVNNEEADWRMKFNALTPTERNRRIQAAYDILLQDQDPFSEEPGLPWEPTKQAEPVCDPGAPFRRALKAGK